MCLLIRRENDRANMTGQSQEGERNTQSILSILRGLGALVLVKAVGRIPLCR